MDRREFLHKGITRLTDAAFETAAEQARKNARRWIRPPYALDELDFLLACTRCDKCVEACPHQVIFNLPARVGLQVAGTPALDLTNKGCHLCVDWPCVNACESGALFIESLPAKDGEGEKKEEENEEEEKEEYIKGTEQEFDPPRPLPLLAIADIDTETCLPYNGPECGACKNSCPVPLALQWQQEKPFIDPEHCVGCGLCREVCIVEPKAVTIRAPDRDNRDR